MADYPCKIRGSASQEWRVSLPGIGGQDTQEYTIEETKSLFNNQAILNLVGIISCILSIIFTNEKKDPLIVEIQSINKLIQKEIILSRKQSESNEYLKTEINILKKRLDDLENSKSK